MHERIVPQFFSFAYHFLKISFSICIKFGMLSHTGDSEVIIMDNNNRNNQNSQNRNNQNSENRNNQNSQNRNNQNSENRNNQNSQNRSNNRGY